MPTPADALRWCATGSAATVLIGAFLPWLRSGERTRSSFETFAIVERLGFREGSAVGIGLRLWALVPLLVIATVVFMWWGWLGRATIAALLGGGFAAVVGLTVATAGDGRSLRIEIGPLVVAIGGIGLVVTTLALLLIRPLGAPRRHEPVG